MVVNIKKVILIFIGAGITNKYQADVCIYNFSGRCIYKGKTVNGKLELYLKEERIYKLKAELCGEYINTVFIVNSNKYVFLFKRSLITNNRTITFLLTDANYKNLPIEKGEMVLWPKQ